MPRISYTHSEQPVVKPTFVISIVFAHAVSIIALASGASFWLASLLYFLSFIVFLAARRFSDHDKTGNNNYYLESDRRFQRLSHSRFF